MYKDAVKQVGADHPQAKHSTDKQRTGNTAIYAECHGISGDLARGFKTKAE